MKIDLENAKRLVQIIKTGNEADVELRKLFDGNYSATRKFTQNPNMEIIEVKSCTFKYLTDKFDPECGIGFMNQSVEIKDGKFLVTEKD